MTIKQFINVITMIPNLIVCSDIEIKPIQHDQIKKAQDIIIQTVFELQILPNNSLEELRKDFERDGELSDLDHIDDLYTHKNGIFLVMTHQDVVIGMGAIKYLDQETCELKRMFFDLKYTGKGLGSKLLETLLEYARKFGYKKIRLSVYNPTKQVKAIHLYKKFDFYEIPSYKQPNADPCNLAKLFMEKNL